MQCQIIIKFVCRFRSYFLSVNASDMPLTLIPMWLQAVLESAIELAWIMSTLLPPSSACKPTVYYQEWQELVTTSDSTVNPETDPNYKLVYCRPILFFGAEGTIGKPGAVKCLPAEPLSLQTTRNEPSQLDSSHHENQLVSLQTHLTMSLQHSQLRQKA